MRLVVGPKSIRGKLVLALLLALAPMVGSQCLREIGEYRRLRAQGVYSWPEVHAAILQTAVAVLLALVVVFVTGNRLGHLVRRLTQAAAAIAVGDYRRRVRIRTGDELEVLGETFNVLGESLAGRDLAIRRQADMLAGMAEAARVASSSLNLRTCGKAIAKATCALLGARDAAVFHRDRRDAGLRSLSYCGRRPRSVWKLVANRAAESGDYLLISERSATQTKPGSHDEAILVGIPLASASGTLGAIVARFEGGLTRSDLSLGGVRADALTAFGVHAAAAIANAAAYSETESYSETLEGWVEELRLVMQVTDAISPSLDLSETLAALARETASALCVDLCVIFLPDRSGGLAVRGCSDQVGAAPLDIRPADMESETGRAFAERRTIACRDTARSKFAATRRITREIGMRALLSTPLICEGRAIGAVTVYTAATRVFEPRELRLLTSIGLHTAVIVRNASLYTRESSIAETLQSNLVSAAPEECDGLRFASRYIPALDEARVGGDFYEVVKLPTGKIGVVIADVSGKGLRAAIHLAACKYMMKPLMFANPDDPAAVLTELNNSINYYFDMSFFVTVFLGVVDPQEGVIEYANAGHVPALLIADGGKVHSAFGSTGIPVGSGYGCNYGSRRVRISPTDMLLLYTDGVIDAKTEHGPIGVEGLHQVVFTAGASSASELIDGICSQLSGSLHVSQNDDMALLAVSFDGVQAGRSTIVGGKGGHDYRIPTEPA